MTRQCSRHLWVKAKEVCSIVNVMTTLLRARAHLKAGRQIDIVVHVAESKSILGNARGKAAPLTRSHSNCLAGHCVPGSCLNDTHTFRFLAHKNGFVRG
jgi:hypothetical protein